MKVLHKEQLMITKIQRMCFHDGPGIRTTVFTKGCSLHCPWCSNPENINFTEEAYETEDDRGIYGRKYTPSELVKALLKDIDYWEENGGVTFSGGEALMQADQLEEVLIKLKDNNIHVALETALFVPEDKLERVLKYIDYFIVDIKILDMAVCKEVLGGEIELYEKNVQFLYNSGKLKLFRIPCCPEYTFTDKNKLLIKEFLKRYSGIHVQIFSVHDLGEKKYESLNRVMWRTKGVEEQELNEYCRELRDTGVEAEVIHI